MNDTKEVGTNIGEGLSPSRFSLSSSVGPVVIVLLRKEVEGERREVNRIIIECYYSSNTE